MLPITYHFQWQLADERLYPWLFAEMAEAGIRHVVLSVHLIARVLSEPAFGARLMQHAAAAGITFREAHASYEQPGQDLACPLPDQQDFVIAHKKAEFAVARDFGIQVITCHCAHTIYGPEYRAQDYIDHTCRALDALTPEAERCGVSVALENIWWHQVNAAENLIALVKRYSSPYLGLCIDTGHALLHTDVQPGHPACQQGAGTPEERLALMAPYLIQCHLHDNNGNDDQHLLPGMGIFPWAKLLPALLSAPHLTGLQNESDICSHRRALREAAQCFDRLARGIAPAAAGQD